MSSLSAKTAPPCRRCGSPVQTIGQRGLCLDCLSATTVGRLSEGEAAAAADQLRLEEGLRLGPHNRFLLHDKLGSGGMGEVWLATDLELSREGEPFWVALKFLSKSVHGNKSALDAVRSEVIRGQELTHPNIVRVFDLHTTQDGLPFIKMEFVKGNSLSYWLEDCPNGVMRWKDVVEIAQQLCGALQYAHETAGVIHRDIKPGNLLLRTDRILKLSDFGIAEALYTTRAASLEKHGLGTLWYASPQQIAGQRPVPADDIHAVGATLYELLTGTPPFLGDSPEFEGDSTAALIHQVRHDPPEPIHNRLASQGIPNEVPARLAELIHRCLEKEAPARPLAREILAELQKIVTGSQASSAVRQKPRVAAPTHLEHKAPQPPVEAPRIEVDNRPQEARSSRAWVVVTILLPLAALAVWQAPLIKDVFAKKPGPPPNRSLKTPSKGTNGESGPVEPTATPPPAPTFTGRLRIQIEGLPKSTRGFEYVIDAASGGRLGPFPLESFHFTTQDIPEGACKITLREGADWYLTQEVAVARNAVVPVLLDASKTTFTIQVAPKDARISWPAGVGPEPGNGEVTGLFRRGVFAVTAVATSYTLEDDKKWVTNLGRNTRPLVQMTRLPYPTPGMGSWTNSLKMVFAEIGNLWVCVSETRVSDFEAFCAATKYSATDGMISTTRDGPTNLLGRSWQNLGPAFSSDKNLPVVGVNWDDAMAFCAWLNDKERPILRPNQRYRLPTTNEWMNWAGPETFPWGRLPLDLFSDKTGPSKGNYAGSELHNDPEWPATWPRLRQHFDGFVRTAPANARFATKNGLFHLGGNAAEWTMEKVLCGGSWADGEEGEERECYDCLKTRNVRQVPRTLREDRNGFRIVLETLPAQSASAK